MSYEFVMRGVKVGADGSRVAPRCQCWLLQFVVRRGRGLGDLLFASSSALNGKHTASYGEEKNSSVTPPPRRCTQHETAAGVDMFRTWQAARCEEPLADISPR